MPNTWLDDAEASDLLGDESAEDYFDGDAEDIDFESYDDDAEAVRDHRRARARRGRPDPRLERLRAQRRVQARVRARRRGMAPTRPRQPATAKAEVRQTKAAVQELGVENEVRAAAVDSRLDIQTKRINSQGAALGATAVANTVASQLQTSFPGVAANPLLRAGLQGAPLLLLKPARRESGFQGFMADPRVWGFSLVAAVTIAGEINSRVQKAQAVRITRFATHLPTKGELRFFAEALDGGGAVLRRKQINWREDPPAGTAAGTFVSVGPDGLVTGLSAGTTHIIAEVVDGTTTKSDKVPVTVV
jgi:hypothetical protein